MNKESCRNFDSDESSESFENSYENDVHSSDETSSQILLYHKKRKVIPIKYSSDEENDVEIEDVDNLDNDWVEIESDDDDLPSRIPFTNINRQIFGNVQQPIDYFKKFITNELITEIITQTNSYANEQIAKKELSARSVWKNWKNVSYDEMLAFFGVILNMGTIYLSDIKDYFSKDFTRNMPFFAKIFKKERFFQIFWMLRLHQDLNNNSYPITRFSKVKSFLNYIDSKFRQNFVPGKEICVDEAVVPFKPTKWGVRMYVLSDSNTGYVYSILPYFGSITSESLIHPELPISARIVLHLYNNLLESIPNSEGYHLYVDRYYTSVSLAEELLKMKCYLTGTIRRDRKFLPRQIRKPTSKFRTVIRYRSRKSKLLALLWRDKRIITILSSYDTGSMKNVSRITRGGYQVELKKPEVILNYNKFMGGVDRADQLGSIHCFLRKTLKWWRKIFFWGIEVSSLNSYILYKADCKHNDTKPMPHIKFIRELVMSLIGNFREGGTPRYGTPSTTDNEDRLDGKLHILQPDAKGKHNDCLVCSNRKLPGGRKTTVYFCETCNRKPFLHVGDCFKKYHTLKTYR
jgi:hypothetical protein